MERNALESKLRELVVEVVGVTSERVTLEAKFADDLAMDDLDVTELVMYAELELNIDLPNDTEEKITTFGDLVDVVEKVMP